MTRHPEDGVQAGLSLSGVCVRALAGAVVKRGLDPERLLAEASVDPLLLHDPSARISLEDWHRLVRLAVELTQEPGLGLLVGGVSEHALQVVGLLVLSAATLREGMRVLERYGVLICDTMQFDLIEEGDLLYFVCTPLVPLSSIPQFEPEMALGLVYRLARRFATLDSCDAREVWMQHAAPAHADRYAAVFRCPVRFGRPKNAILAPRRYLDQRQAFADLQTYELLRDCAERMLEKVAPPSLVERVRVLLRYEPDLSQVDPNRIARSLRLYPSVLRRQLLRAHAPWSSLLDEARCRVACEQLRDPETSIRELSERLGFSQQSAFTRAFKRWTGQTPAQYARAAHTPGAPLSVLQTRMGQAKQRA
jgi:AraC-like DNA-binding protein